jgi:translation elongation factor EF-G
VDHGGSENNCIVE